MSIIKLKEFLETCVCLQYVMEAENIHPSILSGLIPVVTPCFADINGEEQTCKSIELHMDVSIQNVIAKQLHIAYVAVNKAKEFGWKYLHLVRIAEDISGIKLTIRGT